MRIGEVLKGETLSRGGHMQAATPPEETSYEPFIAGG